MIIDFNLPISSLKSYNNNILLPFIKGSQLINLEKKGHGVNCLSFSKETIAKEITSEQQ